MNCRICGEPIVLIPSAEERAKKCGGTPADYSSLFTTHTSCALKEREQGTKELIDRINSNQQE